LDTLKQEFKRRGRPPKERNILNTILQEEEVNCPAAEDVNILEFPGGNEALKTVYDEMHSRGPSAWFSDGAEERKAILEMGEPWGGLKTLEIGCGEGDLLQEILYRGSKTIGIDYSHEAIMKGKDKYPHQNFHTGNYAAFQPIEKYFVERANRLVMQGVLEHLDNPLIELKWMMDNLLTENGDVITSSPCFTNPRGIVWMTLNALGAVMSKTDLHYLNVWEFEEFCEKNGYGLKYQSCDFDWGFGERMIADLRQRIPLALKDGGLPYNEEKVEKFLVWLSTATRHIPLKDMAGSTMVYKINKGR
jgi:2-polyprenyl-3-methyl-5-hydroxy-6-metoxy-1,4-benzoquinol methylase